MSEQDRNAGSGAERVRKESRVEDAEEMEALTRSIATDHLAVQSTGSVVALFVCTLIDWPYRSDALEALRSEIDRRLPQPTPAPAEAPAMPDTSYPVRMVLDLEPDEHAEWLALAKAAGLTIEQWLVATVRAARAVER